MKTARKSLLIALCAVLLVVASVMGTLAYLTADTDVVTNTFTVGSVAIDLDEAKTDVYGDVVTGEEAARIKANQYKLIPGHDYTKDPTVHVTSGSEPSYIFVKVENGISSIEATGTTTIAAQMTAKGWKALTNVDNVFYYIGVGEDADENGVQVDARNAQVDLVVFESFTLADDADVSDYGSATITIDAYAVQADGFTNAADAWTNAPTTW